MIRRIVLHTENRVKVYLSAEDLYKIMKKKSDFFMSLSDTSVEERDEYWIAHALAIDAMMYDIDAEMHGTFFPHPR